MKPLLTLALIPLSATIAGAATTAAFDGGAQTPISLGAGVTSEAAGGNGGGFLQLTANINSQNNYATFDRSDIGAAPSSTFSFQFRIDALGAGGADGFNFTYLPTATYGNNGVVQLPGAAEDPAAAGVLGFGFDTWGNAGPLDAVPAVGTFDANYSEISVFWNGGLVARIDDTRLLPVDAFNLKDGAWHQVDGTVDFALGSISLSVDSNPLWTNLAVPGLTPFESRIGMGARTGGANARHGIDNVNVSWVPEPGSTMLTGLAALSLLSIRRRK